MNEPKAIKPFRFTYENWRGEVAQRCVTPQRVFFGSTDYHKQPQWLMDAWDVDKQAHRTFAMDDIGGPRPNELTKTQHAITQELYKAVEALGGDAALLGLIGSFGDTMDDEDVLSALQSYNETGSIFDEVIAEAPHVNDEE